MAKHASRIILIFSLIFFSIFTGYTESPEKPGFWHTIQWGETLILIARKYDIDPAQLAKANNIYNWNCIYAGNTLWIPQGELIEVYVYTVQKGDTLGNIAEKFNIDMWEIAALNHIYNMNLIFEDQTLYIPVTK